MKRVTDTWQLKPSKDVFVVAVTYQRETVLAG